MDCPLNCIHCRNDSVLCRLQRTSQRDQRHAHTRGLTQTKQKTLYSSGDADTEDVIAGNEEYVKKQYPVYTQATPRHG